MIVAVEKDLTLLQKELARLGYDVVTYNEYKSPVDAVVYDSARDFDGYLSILTNEITGLPHGVLMVNSHKKTIRQIDRILSTRLYSPLF